MEHEPSLKGRALDYLSQGVLLTQPFGELDLIRLTIKRCRAERE